MSQLIINRNECLYPPSPKVRQVLKNFPIEKTSRYIEGYYQSPLVLKLSKIFGLPDKQVLVFYGLEDFFRNLFDGLDKKQDKVLTNQYHFAYFSL